jgi:hypothetical protein
MFSVQLAKPTGGNSLAYVWLRKNGTDIPLTNNQAFLKGNDAEVIMTVPYFLQLTALDYIEVVFSSTDSTVFIKTDTPGAGLGPTVPSIIANIKMLVV